MAGLKGSKTEGNLKAAFAGESQANRRYLYFANKADVEGYADVAGVFRNTAEGETGHARQNARRGAPCDDAGLRQPKFGSRPIRLSPIHSSLRRWQQPKRSA